jgi:hypothetical protein
MRLLFASIHSYVDPSTGAALATRELVELLAARGMDCRVLCAGVLDYERGTTLAEVLATLGLPAQRFVKELGGGHSTGWRGISRDARTKPGQNTQEAEARTKATAATNSPTAEPPTLTPAPELGMVCPELDVRHEAMRGRSTRGFCRTFEAEENLRCYQVPLFLLTSEPCDELDRR